MRIDDAYRLLEITPAASDEELKAAHRDLTKVWHPDRFAHDPPMQMWAEEKLKAINEAYETIRDDRGGRGRRWSAEPREPQPPPHTPQQRLRRLLGWMLTCVALGLFILVRRPTFGGLLIAVALFAVAGFLVLKMRRIEREGP
ncbi:MAG TPA: J domain-containing protein [Thermoanaerobaculia bacterium]|nr:J domain-containing protein [Thermoanaerobaculia bacterium]